MTKHKITIDIDGWVYLTQSDGDEIGLGHIGVDVEIEDRRGDPVQQERERIVSEVYKALEEQAQQCLPEELEEWQKMSYNRLDIKTIERVLKSLST